MTKLDKKKREEITKRKKELIEEHLPEEQTQKPEYEDDLGIAQTKKYSNLMMFQILNKVKKEQVLTLARDYDKALERCEYNKNDCELLDCYYEQRASLTDNDGKIIETA